MKFYFVNANPSERAETIASVIVEPVDRPQLDQMLQEYPVLVCINTEVITAKAVVAALLELASHIDVREYEK